MPISRTAMMATGSQANRPIEASENIAPSTSTLSASGSRKAPERVVPWRRAIQPSMPSVLARMVHRTKTSHDACWVLIIENSSGETSRRMTVTKLAGVASAEGP